MEFTFGSYNLEHGGIDGGGRDVRLVAQLEMLAAVNADVWAFQECNGWADDGYGYLHFAENVLGMRGFLARSNHHGCDLAVFIREASGIKVNAQRHEEGPPYWHAVARVEVIIDDLLYSMVSAHLAPSSPALRLIEAEAFALIAREGTVIAGGDWNAVPAADPEPDTSRTSPGKARRKLDRSAALAIEEAGFTDAAACLSELIPTVGHASDLYYRCDRIYTTLPAAAITGYQVIAEDRPASDHRPVVARFNLASPLPEGTGLARSQQNAAETR
jgi:endonuclease/exonuclease/phosphatase family metal-dependent hydrolase